MAQAGLIEAALDEHRKGNLKEADRLYREALVADPGNGEALHNLATIGGLIGDMSAAVQLLESAIRTDPENPKYWESMGNACMTVGELEKALQAFKKSFDFGNRDPDLLLSFGVALLQAGSADDGAKLLLEARKLRPDNAMVLFQLGNAHSAQHRWKRAVEAYEAAVTADPELEAAQTNLGFAILHRHEPEPMAAVEPFEAGFRLRREAQAPDPGLDTYNSTSLPKLRHDAEQFAWLAAEGKLPESLAGAEEAFDAVIREIDWSAQDAFMVQLSEDQTEQLKPWYNRASHTIPAATLSGPAVNPDLDDAEISKNYQSEAPGIVFFDDLLTEEALTALRRFCLESTIWYDFSHPRGYLGAHMEEGMYAPLFAQIAEEIRLKFPDIIGEHRLRQLWAYKYNFANSGVSTHADRAAVHVNFWITPDDANLDPDSGGLLIYKTEAPRGWNFEEYNSEPQKIRAFLEEKDAGSVQVPYKQNRAAIFNSDLFHESASIHFKSGYENRRISITMLFGDRAHG